MGRKVEVMGMKSGGHGGRALGESFQGIEPAWNLDMDKAGSILLVDEDFKGSSCSCSSSYNDKKKKEVLEYNDMEYD